MRTYHDFEEMTPEKRPQDPFMNGRGCQFVTCEHGGEYPDTMPQAIRFVDSEGRSAIYVAVREHGKVVDSEGFGLIS